MADFQWASSWTDVANTALKSLGEKLINSIGEASALASYCRQHLPTAIEEVLSLLDWQAARSRASLARLTETPPFGFDYYYQLPSGYIRAVSFDTGGEDYSPEGDRVLTDASAVDLVYIGRPEDPTKLVPYLRNLISARLADILTIPITSSDNTAARVKGEYAEALRIAKAADARARRQPTLKDELGFTYWDEMR